MCIVIDVCALSPVFKKANSMHGDFGAVREWIIDGKGKVVYGGKKYTSELRKTKEIFSIFIELERMSKIVRIDDNKVNAAQEKLKNANDAHLIAIIIVSKCKLICTNDHKAIPDILDSTYYPKGISRPKVYTGKQNAKTLLVDSNIADCCKPAKKLSKAEKKMIRCG